MEGQLFLLIWVIICGNAVIPGLSSTLRRNDDVSRFLDTYNTIGSQFSNEVSVATWGYRSNISDGNSQKMRREQVRFSVWSLNQSKIAKGLSMDNLNVTQQRLLRSIRTSAVSENKTVLERLAFVTAKMSDIYSRAQVVLDNGTALPIGQGGVNDFFRHSEDYDALASVWKKWRDASGKMIRDYYVQFIQLINKGAQENGYSDYGYYEWFTDFDDASFDAKVLRYLDDLHGLYKELHAYVRYKLSRKYPGRFDSKGPIPAHLLGNPWAQTWSNIFPLVKPYPNATGTDITDTLKRQNWTTIRIFKAAEEFFTSLGLPAMTKTFWEKSIIENPGDRVLNCHASAWDFSKGDDFRILMCTKINQQDFFTVHHEMGHIEYFMMYADQPLSFRTGANSGFHEAIGDTISLSVSTAKHLHEIGLLDVDSDSQEAQINALMLTALEKIAFLPFGLTVDVWRWLAFNGSASTANFNQEWWRLRKEFQGLKPPVTRSEMDLDPAAKYHVANNVPYIRYFTSFIMQFQFYEAMCNASGHTGPLHRCDFYRSKEAGDLMKRMLSLGRSKPWPEAMETITGQPEIDLGALNRYFAPLQRWLVQRRVEFGYPIGW